MIFAILGSLGGVVAFLCAIAVIVRSISRQVSATESNTKALNELKDTVQKLDSTVDDQNVRLVRVEERAERTGGGMERVERGVPRGMPRAPPPAFLFPAPYAAGPPP